jgi:hypothetical protein
MTRNHPVLWSVRIAGRAALAVGLLGLAGVAGAQENAAGRYAELLAHADSVGRYNALLEQQIAAQQQQIAMLEQESVALDATALEVQPLLQRMFDDLERFVAADVPFLMQERSERVARLRDLMNQVEVSVSEKYRRLLEAYQIELEYGRTMEAYQDTLGDGREAEFVRLGRVSLMYRTADGSESGYWDHEQKAWVADNRYAAAILTALRIAREEVAPDLITVPVPAAQEVSS